MTSRTKNKKPLPGWNWSNVGNRAKKLKVPLGRIACPHCGTVIRGVIEPTCGLCEKLYWPESKKYNHIYFNNEQCKFHPCHNMTSINCIFCYCPLYNFEDCGGRYKWTKDLIKDCSKCTLPHDSKKGYNYVISRIKK